MGKRRGKKSNYKAAYCDGMLLCLFLDFEGTLSGLNNHSLVLPSFLGNTWVFSNSEELFFFVDSGEGSMDLRRHKPVRTKLKEHISENLDVLENPACRKECYNNIKL